MAASAHRSGKAPRLRQRIPPGNQGASRRARPRRQLPRRCVSADRWTGSRFGHGIQTETRTSAGARVDPARAIWMLAVMSEAPLPDTSTIRIILRDIETEAHVGLHPW